MTDHAQRLAEAVRTRRLAMGGMTQKDASAAAGVSDTTWNQVERGMNVSERSLAKISTVLWGDAGTGAMILAGLDAPDGPPDQGLVPSGDLLQAIQDLTEIVRQLREDLRRGRP